MSESTRMWTEIIFNSIYLVSVWVLVALMFFRRHTLGDDESRVAKPVMQAFFLLALGDTGHVGFRNLAYALGDLGARVSFLGLDLRLVGIGALSTAFTVTGFYMLMVKVWKERFDKRYTDFALFLLAMGIFRFVLMLWPQNQWNSLVPPQPWSIFRNIPLMIQGLGVAYLILRDAKVEDGGLFRWIGILILVSYAFYIPVILWVRRLPLLGMLMIPKTIAYLAIGVIAYVGLYRRADDQALGAPTSG